MPRLSQSRNRAFALAFLAIAATMFVIRGPARAPAKSDDLAPPYAATRAFLEGVNPYSDTVLVRVLTESGRELEADGRPPYNPSLYPPPTFVALAPLSLASWPVARIAFLLVTLALFAWHIRSLFRLADLSAGTTGALWLLGGTLALAPYHTGIALGQLAIPCVTLVVIALALLRRGRSSRGGVTLGIATLLKPQLAGPFILYAALRGHRRASLVAVAVGAAATLVSLGWLAANDVSWLSTWREVTGSIQVADGPADPAGPLSSQMIDLRPLLSLAGIEQATLVGLALAALAAVALWTWGRHLPSEHDLLIASAVGVLTLFVTYHRFYDAAILCLPLAWAIRAGAPTAGRIRLAVLACCAVFFIPGAWALQVLADRGELPSALVRSALWDVVLLRHQNWALVILMLLLLAAVRRARTASPS